MERRWFNRGGERLSYLVSESAGPTVLILHGLAGSSNEMIPTAEALSERHVLLLDQRGHGESSRKPADTSRAAFVADAVALIELGSTGPIALIGQSMGAHTAMLVAAARPDLVDRLVLLEGGEGSGDPKTNARMGEFFASWPVPFATVEAARAFLGDGPLESAWASDLERREDGYYPRFDSDVMVRVIDAVAVPRWSEWESVVAPTLAVFAENGLFTQDAKAEFVRRGRKVQCAEIAGASHDAHLDSFDAWIALVKEFLGEESHASDA
ncbi:alpha/beta fold hydrolase [Agreia bicolorata]|uniref:Alpha/beta hydrolase n=1 Tax=Agreia bicolorata TaxID=110935 RepID=A0ABR5CE39_9MICO|nr:alpha/beta hydrolase [Agreia bicolorata]KJC63857.1 alpha/beta hydrolase [Agreia bicolorata]